jgi:hypothetical protein
VALSDAFIVVSIDPQQERKLRNLARKSPKAMKAALRRSFNRSVDSGITHISRKIGDELVLKKSIIKEAFKAIKARSGYLTATIRIRRKGIPLREYSVSETTKGVSRKGLKAVTTKVRRGGPRERHKYAFIVREFGGHVFERKVRGGRRVGRGPIQKRYGPSILGVFENEPGMEDRAIININEILNKNIDQQVEFEFLKLLGRS